MTTIDERPLQGSSPPGDAAAQAYDGRPDGRRDGRPDDSTDDSTHDLIDRELLDAMARHQVVANRAHAQRLAATSRFHARRVAEQQQSKPAPGAGFFQLTPLRETQAEVAPLLGASEQSIQIDIDTLDQLTRWLPRLWDRCLTGRLDLWRALACLNQLPHLATDADRASYATAIQDWFDKHDPLDHPGGPEDHGLCTLTRNRIDRAARYQRLKLPQRQDTETFAEAFRKRRVSLRLDQESGMACLAATTAAHDALTADHRLTMIAKKRSQAPGETRTLAQLRADSLLDLIHGRLVVPATTGDLEHHEGCDHTCRAHPETPGDLGDRTSADVADSGAAEGGSQGERTCPLHPLLLTGDNDGPLGGYARPAVAVTVPISTLLGFSNEPGMLSGTTPIPADYARHIATQPGSTWYRMLTDDAGNFLALSTNSYQPTDAIWRIVTVRDHTCVWPGCNRPAVVVQIDHRVAHPAGETSTDNLQPLCERHHPVKHADGYSVVRNDDGSYTWTTRHGSTFRNPASEQPLDGQPSRHANKADAGLDQGRVDEIFAALTGPLEHAFAGLIVADDKR